MWVGGGSAVASLVCRRMRRDVQVSSLVFVSVVSSGVCSVVMVVEMRSSVSSGRGGIDGGMGPSSGWICMVSAKSSRGSRTVMESHLWRRALDMESQLNP